MNKRQIVIIAHDIRSAHNVGSLLRTADGIGVDCVYLTGYTPYPIMDNDTRMPHIAQKLNRSISKTALGAELSQPWMIHENLPILFNKLATEGYTLVALEQSNQSIALNDYKFTDKVAILIGREVEGIDTSILKSIGIHLEIPMFGKKESYNVVQACAMLLYAARFN